jgi:hypothetical protein
MINEEITFWKSLKSGLKGGLIASGVNIGWLFSISYFLAIQGLPKGFPIAVVFSTIIPIALGAMLFAFLMMNFKKGHLLFYLFAGGFTGLSILPSFQPILPDGSAAPANFAVLTVPMHLFAALIGVFYIVKGK